MNLQEVRELDWLSKLVLFKIKGGLFTTVNDWQTHIKNPMRVRLKNDSGQTNCTLTIDLMAWDSFFQRFELIDMFKNVAEPVDKIHATGCLHSPNPDMVIQDTFTASMAKAFYFRLCSRALVKVEDIGRGRVDRLKVSEDDNRSLDTTTRLVLNTQARIFRGFGNPSDLVDMGFRYNASREHLSIKTNFQILWSLGHDPKCHEATDKGYQNHTWRARPWHIPSEEAETSATSIVL